MDSELKTYLDTKFAGAIEHIEFRLQQEIAGFEHRINIRFDQIDQRIVLIGGADGRADAAAGEGV